MLFDQTFKNIKRTQEIVAILIKYGFEDVVAATPLKRLMPKSIRRSGAKTSVLAHSRWERIRMVFEELGPTFIKLAQVLSNRPDILPDPLITEFQKLQSDVPPFPYEQVQSILEKELKQPLKSFFKFFDDVPLGSASIGQVHAAILRDGSEVVVKVRRPGVGKAVATDLSIMRDLAGRGEQFFERHGIINVMDVVDAFDRSMQKELDYLTEARNIELFRNHYAEVKDFYVPKVYREYSTSKVLVLEMVKGCKITDVKQLEAWNQDPARIAERGLDIYLTQIFEHGIFHADPHPGNIIIQRNGRICLIDFGMIGTLMRKDKFALAGVFVGMAQQNPQRMADSLRKLAIDDNITEMRAFEYDLHEIIEDFATLSVEESNIADFTMRLQKVIYDHRIRVPGGVFIIMRALAILEGIGKAIHPNFQTYEFIKPYGLKLLKEQLDPKSMAGELATRGQQMQEFMTSFPVEVRDILVKTRKGKLHFEMELTDYLPILQRFDQITNRLSMTLLIVGMLIGSSIMATSSTLPTNSWGIPYLSAVGFSIAAALALILWFRTRGRK